MVKEQWLQWLGASAAAGTGGVASVIIYMHSHFVSAEQLQTHVEQPHKGTIEQKQYYQDMRFLRDQIRDINKKLDRALERN